MNIIIACEYSGIERDAFIKHGHDAISCDILPTESIGPHLQCDIRDVDLSKYDLMIAHPPCRYLAISGARWMKDRQKEIEESLQLVRYLMGSPVEHIAIENPVSIISTHIRKPDQYIHPWQFGHGETKKTCLWLKNLPLLIPTNIVSGRDHRIHTMGPSKNRSKLRSLSYTGIAEAMADQWG